jgi:erythromycin esterase
MLLIVLITCARVAGACSVFALQSERGMVVGRNLDWNADLPGLVVVNPAGIEKTVLPWKRHEPDLDFIAPMISWTARFGSVTFTAYGRDFIESGMNEAGLVISGASSSSSYPPDGRPGISCSQWMQYQLDRHATVSEVVDHIEDLRLDGEGWHFLVADAGGDCAVIESTTTGPRVFSSGPGRPCILTNANYASALEHLPMDTAFGGELPIASGNDSYARFVRCAAMIRDWCPNVASDPSEYAAVILDALAEKDTLRSIVYDPRRGRIRWTSRDKPVVRSIEIGDLDLSPGATCRILPVEVERAGNVSEALRPYTDEANRAVVRAAFASILGQLPVATLRNNAADNISRVALHPTKESFPAVVRELNEQLVTLPPGSPLGYPASAFAPITEVLADARVVGLGEATHGSAEFFELKHRLFRHLVEVHGHRALGYELSFAASLAIDRHITTGEGSLDDLLAGLSWIQANEEVRALLGWMREHNRGVPAEDQIRFIGIDSQLDMWSLDLHRAIFRDRFPELERELGQLFDELGATGKIDYRKLTREEYDRIARLLATMASIVDQRSSDLSREQRLVASHLIEALKHSHEFLLSAYQGDNNVRDSHLAENALWIGELLDDGARYSIWAHSSHVGTNALFHGDIGPGSMGVHITRRLGEAYVRIGTAFTRGSFVAVQSDWRGRDTPPIVCRIDEDPPFDSVNAILERASSDRYLLLLRSIPDGSALYRFFDAERPMLGVGDCFAGVVEPHYRGPTRITRILDAYDAVYYFSNTGGVHPLVSIASH